MTNQHDDPWLSWLEQQHDVQTSAGEDDQVLQEGGGRFRRSNEDPPYEPERGLVVGMFFIAGTLVGTGFGYVLGRWIVPGLFGLH